MTADLMWTVLDHPYPARLQPAASSGADTRTARPQVFGHLHTWRRSCYCGGYMHMVARVHLRSLTVRW